MWTPTHVQVTVQRAKGLLLKGKNGTNDAFVTICLGKEKYQTSVKERVADPVDWHEECELAIPRHGNKAEIILTVLHRNFIGDEFLGQVTIPLSDFDVYDKPKNRWYGLKCKPGQDKTNYRGDIEVRVSFTVQSGVSNAGSLSDLKKDGIRASFGQLSQKVGSSIGGSLLSLKGKGDKKGLKGLAKAVGSKVNKVSTLPGRGHKKKGLDDTFGAIPEQLASGSTTNLAGGLYHSNHRHSEADPGVISDDEDEFRFDELSHKSSHSSLSVSQVALGTPRDDGSLENLGGGEFLRRNYATPPPVKPNRSSTSDPIAPPSEKPERWSTGPIDDWETKLFGKQQTILDKAASSSLRLKSSSSRNSLGNGNISEDTAKEEDSEDDGKRGSLTGESPLKPTFQSIFSTAAAGATTGVLTTTAAPTSPPPAPTITKDSKEPVPKPRQQTGGSGSPVVTKTKSFAEEPKVKGPAPPPPVVSTTKSSSNNSKEVEDAPVKPPQKAKAPSANINNSYNNNNNYNNNNHNNNINNNTSSGVIGGTTLQKELADSSDFKQSPVITNSTANSMVLSKETPNLITTPKQQPSSQSPANLNNSSLSHDNNGGDDMPNNQKWTPVGITNPIRQKEPHHQETRLPRETLKKFENRSREDLIELIMKQQHTLEYQKQKMNDMEDYIDNLLVRVMENKPTLLQTPYVTHRPMKFTSDPAGDWFALSD